MRHENSGRTGALLQNLLKEIICTIIKVIFGRQQGKIRNTDVTIQKTSKQTNDDLSLLNPWYREINKDLPEPTSGEARSVIIRN